MATFYSCQARYRVEFYVKIGFEVFSSNYLLPKDRLWHLIVYHMANPMIRNAFSTKTARHQILMIVKEHMDPCPTRIVDQLFELVQIVGVVFVEVGTGLCGLPKYSQAYQVHPPLVQVFKILLIKRVFYAPFLVAARWKIWIRFDYDVYAAQKDLSLVIVNKFSLADSYGGDGVLLEVSLLMVTITLLFCCYNCW